MSYSLSNMTLPIFLLGILGTLVQISQSFSVPNIEATFQDSPQPFELKVDPSFIGDVHSRVKNARAPIPVLDSPVEEGTPLANWTIIRDYWVYQYNWNETQANINQRCVLLQTAITHLKKYRIKQLANLNVKAPSIHYSSPSPGFGLQRFRSFALCSPPVSTTRCHPFAVHSRLAGVFPGSLQYH